MFHGGTYQGILEPVFWFDAGQKITKGGDDRVSLWGDLSPYARDVASIGGGGYRDPLWVNSVINGLPAVLFTQDGVASNLDMLSYEPANVFPDNTGGISYPRMVFAVIQPNGSNVIASVMAFRQSTPLYAVDMWTTAGTQYGYDDGIAVNVPFTAVVDYTDTPILISWIGTTTDITIRVNRVNRVQVSTALGNESGVHKGFSIGRKRTDITELSPKYIAEILCFFGNDSRLQAETESRLMTKFAL